MSGGNVPVDWPVRAHLRVYVTRAHRKYGCMPDLQERAGKTVLEQADLLSATWMAGWSRWPSPSQ